MGRPLTFDARKSWRRKKGGGEGEEDGLNAEPEEIVVSKESAV